MKKIKRIVACFCVCVLLATAPATAYAKANSFKPTAEVLELIVLGFTSTPQGALVVALGLVGITGVAAVYDNRESIVKFGQDMFDRAERWFDEMGDKISVTWNDFQSWLGDVANGALDTSSECWDAFKDFCTDLANEVSAGDSSVSADSDNFYGYQMSEGVFGFWSCGSTDYMIRKGLEAHPWAENWNYGKCPYTIEPSWSSSDFWFSVEMNMEQKFGDYEYECLTASELKSNKNSYSVVAGFFDGTILSSGLNSIDWYYLSTSGSVEWLRSINNLSAATNRVSDEQNVFRPYISNVITFNDKDAMTEYLKTGEIDWTHVISDFLPTGWTWNSDGEFCVGPHDTLPWTGTSDIGGVAEGVWGDVSDVVVAPDTDGVIDRDGNLDNVGVADVTGVIIDGVISIPIDGVDGVSISNPYEVIDGVYPVDTIDGTILGTDTPIDGITPVNPSGCHDYTIPNLQELFPFCIPWDLVSLFKTLKADPEAPCFKFPLPVPKKDGGFTYKYIEIDLSDFNSVAKVLRTMELLAFCVGLTLATRNLIRG